VDEVEVQPVGAEPLQSGLDPADDVSAERLLALMSCPVGLKTFEPRTTSSRQSEMSVPRIFSDAPSP